ncbi:hypothetical protein HKD37_20G056216 [Glycine soja]
MSDLDVSDKNVLEYAFDNLLNDSHILTKKCENKVLKEKVEKLPKDLANFVDGTKNLDKLIGVQRSFYYRIGISFNMNPNKVFQRPNKYKIAKIKCSNCNKWRHKPHNVTERGTFLSER